MTNLDFLHQVSLLQTIGIVVDKSIIDKVLYLDVKRRQAFLLSLPLDLILLIAFIDLQTDLVDLSH